MAVVGTALAVGLGAAASVAVVGYTQLAAGPIPAATSLPASVKPRPSELLKPSDLKASSFISNAREQHPPRDAFDGEKKTAWNESAKGPGAGEWIEASWPVPRRIRRVVFSTGFDHISSTEGDLFPRNAHAKAVRLVFSDGTTITRQVAAEQREVEVTELNVVSASLRLIADEVWPGSSWQDWCVSEIQIWADPLD